MATQRTVSFDAVYANPDDDGPRLVAGDALLELNDPRGELIAEQRRRTDKGNLKPSKRERELAKKHAVDWLGPLNGVLRQPTFRLGFLSSAALKGGKHDWEPLAALPEWRTIEKLLLGAVSSEQALELLAIPQLVSLREVSAVDVTLIEAVAKRVGPLRWTKLVNVSPFGANGGNGFAELPKLAKWLPKVTSLSLADSGMMAFTIDDYSELFASKFVRQLEELELHCDSAARAEVSAAANALGIKRVTIH